MMKYKMDDLNLDDLPTASLYRPNMDDFVSSIIGCFIIGDDWDKPTLLALKDKAGASALVGLQIDNTECKHLDSINSIIKCQPDEVQNVVELLDVKSASSLIAIDVVDIESLFEGSQSFQFIQTRTINNESVADSIKTTTHNFFNRLSIVNDIKALLIGIESIEVLPLESLNYITEAVEAALSDDISIYYSSWINPDFDCFKLKAIYTKG